MPTLSTYLFSVGLLFAGLVSPSPLDIRTVLITPQIIQSIAPQSGSCENAPRPSECRTAAQALVPIVNSINQYAVNTREEMAAIISLMAFESGDFKYRTPVNQVSGKGCRNMQSATFNILYAQSIPSLATSVQAITQGATVTSLSPTQLNQVLAKLTDNDDYDFGSAAWFLTSQCSATIRKGLQTGGRAGWLAYVSNCIGTTPTNDREAYYLRAVTALGAI